MPGRKFVQDQKSFSGGQSNPSAFARLSNDVFTRALKLENVIVDKEGSVSVRGGFKQLFKFEAPPGDGVEFLDVSKTFKFEYRNDQDDIKDVFLFFCRVKINNVESFKIFYKIDLESGSPHSIPVSFKQGVLSYDLNKVAEKNSDGDYSVDFQDYGPSVFTDHGLPADSTREELINADQAGNVVFVFFDECFPYKIWVENGFLKTAPFFDGETNKLYNCFPCGRTVENLNTRSMVVKEEGDRFLNYIDEDEELTLRVINVKWTGAGGTGECEIFLDYKSNLKKKEDFVDFKLATLRKFKGFPISFTIGLREFEIRGLNASEWVNEDNVDNLLAKEVAGLLDPEVKALLESGELTQNDEVGNANKMSAIKVGMDSDVSLSPGSEVGFSNFTASYAYTRDGRRLSLTDETGFSDVSFVSRYPIKLSYPPIGRSFGASFSGG